MCGIFCCVYSRCSTPLVNVNQELTKNRGPDSFGTECFPFGDHLNVLLECSVLHMRGSSTVVQPLCCNANVLCFNGEIYRGISNVESYVSNDSQLLIAALDDCEFSDDLIKVFSQLKGPYAFVYYDKRSQCIYFGRDVFGRRSLLIGKESHAFYLSSVHPNSQIEMLDLPAGIIFQAKCIDNISTLFAYTFTEPFENSLANICNLFDTVSVVDHSFRTPIYSTLNKELYSIKYKPQDCLDDILQVQKGYVQEWMGYLSESVRRRLVFIENVSELSILFSGGVDSLLLVAIAHLILPVYFHIHLINVAFSSTQKFDVPDRQTGLLAYANLCKLYPDRAFHFIPVDVGLEEVKYWRCKRIGKLLLPQNTVLDDSIACALWFAARGAHSNSSSKILLVGTGADELLGGYSRHRAKYTAHGREALINELEMEIKRIAYRNLGRDDRILSDCAVESRLPYLDEDLLLYTNELPLEVKCNLNLPRGLGEKLLLRLALRHCGFDRNIVQTPKRAMQFGSKIAKLEQPKERGSDVCHRL